MKTVDKDYLDTIKSVYKQLKEIEDNTHPMDCRHVTEAIMQLEYYLMDEEEFKDDLRIL
ncbi:hypothetical protein [Lysinibacillus fusiformis]|uniref:hypothetical protein n=1 Tax=Lysinibacillus fusiformis TaxID=28031 RepID=UPI00263AD68D|nr:hypothetical protein [Lysinibacillus fusiformis]MDC6267283.1 hypothetical protein [Lysinibacillus sphaericus]MDN4968283.1 hypothetical protein [Lysinibacillus fusiformis]MDN4968457.1 hypothetical protein [Lysinibacillus fusiformis]